MKCRRGKEWSGEGQGEWGEGCLGGARRGGVHFILPRKEPRKGFPPHRNSLPRPRTGGGGAPGRHLLIKG